MGLAASSSNKSKPQQEDITFCVICYENEIQTLKLDCGHVFCNDCILTLHEYEDCPRCPLCRQFIGAPTGIPLDGGEDSKSRWFKVGRKSANVMAVVVSSCLFCYNILPMMQEYFRDWNLTMVHELFNELRLECGRVKGVWF